MSDIPFGANPSVRYIYGEGPKDAQIVFIGEAPGASETLKGRPFVGSAGELLNNLMTGLLNRSDVYITNVIKVQPQRNDIKQFIDISGSNIKLSDEARKHIAYLEDELYDFPANVFVAIGAIPLWVLTGRKGVLKLRGSILEGQIRDRKIKVIPTIHPAAVLHAHDLTLAYLIRRDLQKVAEQAKSPAIEHPKRTMLIKPSFDEVMGFLEYCKTCPYVGFDIEVLMKQNYELACISFATSPWEAISIPFFWRGDNYFTPPQEAAVMLSIAELLENPNIKKVGQNLVFDIHFLFSKYGIRTRSYGGVEDTMIGQGIRFPDFPKGLDFITSFYTDEPYYKDDGKWWKNPGMNDEQFAIYNAKDSLMCMEAMPKITAELVKQENMETYDYQRRLIEPLVFMQSYGVLVDIDAVQRESAQMALEIEDLTAQFTELAGREINLNSPKQLLDYFYYEKGHKPYVKRGTGKPSVDMDALKRLARKGVQEAEVLLKVRKLSKMKSTYFDAKIDPDNRLRCSFNPVGTTTGRLSSSKNIFGTGLNQQNLPPPFLKHLHADEGFVMYQVDLAQAENRIVAYIAPDYAMMQAFEGKVDLHKQTAALIFGKMIDEISDVKGSSSLGTGEHSERDWGKKGNHSLNYDLGYKAFALLNEMPEHEAKMIVDRYHAAYPGVRQYHAWIRMQLRKDRTITNLYGRKRQFLGHLDDKTFKEAYAYIPQSTVADKINRDGVIPIYEDQKRFGPLWLLNQVHDAIYFQISREYPWLTHADILCWVKEMLERPLEWQGRTFVIPADFKMGLTMSKDKKTGMQTVDANEFESASRLAKWLDGVYR